MGLEFTTTGPLNIKSLASNYLKDEHIESRFLISTDIRLTTYDQFKFKNKNNTLMIAHTSMASLKVK